MNQSFTHQNKILRFNPSSLAREITLGFMRDVCSKEPSFPLAEIKNQESTMVSSIEKILQLSVENFNQLKDRNPETSPYSLFHDTMELYAPMNSTQHAELPPWVIALNGYILGSLLHIFSTDFDSKYKINNADDLMQQFKSFRPQLHPEINATLQNACNGISLDPVLIDSDFADYSYLNAHISKESLLPYRIIWTGNHRQLEKLNQILKTTLTLPEAELQKLQRWFSPDSTTSEVIEIVNFKSNDELFLLFSLFAQLGWKTLPTEQSYSLIQPVNGTFKSSNKWLSKAIRIAGKEIGEKEISHYNEKDYINRKDRQKRIKALSECLRAMATLEKL